MFTLGEHFTKLLNNILAFAEYFLIWRFKSKSHINLKLAISKITHYRHVLPYCNYLEGI